MSTFAKSGGVATNAAGDPGSGSGTTASRGNAVLSRDAAADDGVGDARPAVDLVHSIRHATPTAPTGGGHPFVVSADRTVEAISA